MSLREVIAKAPVELTAQRLATCRACDLHRTAPVTQTEFCKACGCPLLNKTKFLKSTCPKGKW
jgi:rRNA maturation endonuclease Nob1